MRSKIFFFLILVHRTFAQTPTTPSSATDTVDILTSFTGYAGCNPDQKGKIEQAAKDAVTIADAGLDIVHDELFANAYPHKGVKQVDFGKQAAIEYFGPEQRNTPEQARILDTMFNAAQAYRGWGLSDYFAGRYVYLSCNNEDDDRACASGGKYPNGNAIAYFSSKRTYGYPLVVFCDPFFNSPKVGSLDDAIKQVDENKDYQQNSLNMRTRATTFLHELLHINWGSAKECRGLNEGEACKDNPQQMGNKRSKTYRPGAAKLLARRNVSLAATNNDNYAFYAASKFMQKRWGTYPKYPSAWDPTKTFEENTEAQKNEPGFPARLKATRDDDVELWDDTEGPNDGTDNGSTDEPLYDVKLYPDWFKPVLTNGTTGNVPDVQEPTGNNLVYNGPPPGDVVCETSDGSPRMNDCFHAFGTLKSHPDLKISKLSEGKKGETYWAGYVHSCAIALYYTENWETSCNFTLKDVNDYATIITEKCSTGANDKIGGHVPIKMNGCPGQVQISYTGSSLRRT